MKRKYEISNQVLDQAKVLGVDEPILNNVKSMLVASAPITHSEGNRRHENFIFRIVDNVVTSIKPYNDEPIPVENYFEKCAECNDTKKIFVPDVCLECDGTGFVSNKVKTAHPVQCPVCHGDKERKVTISCPACKD